MAIVSRSGRALTYLVASDSKSNFHVRLGQRREEVQLSSAHWWRSDGGVGIRSHQVLPAHGHVELDLEMHAEPPLTAKSGV